jgi:flagellar basal body rod protein FlgG
MSDGIYVALSGAIAQTASLDATAANLANASTDGYQGLRPVFREELSRASGKEPALHYTTTQGTQTDTAPGSLRATGHPLDFAMPQGTYLAVITSGGERYTRAASLSVGRDGTLINAGGTSVSGEDGKPIKVTGDTANLRIDASGQVRQGDDVVGHVKLVSFATPARLSHEAGALLAATPQSGTPTPSAAKLENGQIEQSNTSVVGAMTDLVSASRTFEAFQRVIDTFRDTDRSTVTTIPSVQ